jgi:hypothetical protein
MQLQARETKPQATPSTENDEQTNNSTLETKEECIPA